MPAALSRDIQPILAERGIGTLAHRIRGLRPRFGVTKYVLDQLFVPAVS
jgi:hypothetical protein